MNGTHHESLLSRLLSIAIITLVLILILLPSTLSLSILLPGRYDFEFTHPALLGQLAFLFIGTSAILYTYYQACSTKPHRPPKWKPPKGSYHTRICYKCNYYKPPRAHHCSACGTCILKMDHHCPWIANCVGAQNHAHFLRFLCWVCITTGSLGVLLLIRARDMLNEFAGNYIELPYLRHTTLFEVIALIASLVICLGVFLSVGILTLFQFWNLAYNTTTIEGWELDRVASMVRRKVVREEDSIFPYDLGVMANFRSVMGPSIWLWLLPTAYIGDGTSWQRIPEAFDYPWPPLAYEQEVQGVAPADVLDDEGSEPDSEDNLPLAHYKQPPGPTWRRDEDGEYLVQNIVHRDEYESTTSSSDDQQDQDSIKAARMDPD